MRVNTIRKLVCAITVTVAGAAFAAEPPSKPGVDAPELARLGAQPVGVRTLEVIAHNQPDVLAFDATRRAAPRTDRKLTVDLWYPAEARPGATPETYSGALDAEAPGTKSSFSIPGLAVRDARPAGGHYPLVIVSHGRSNVTAALTWLTENLASKGYVVAAIRHEDPPYTDGSKFVALGLRRPLDIAVVTASLQASLGREGLIDPARTALVGYSLGGYGVLTAGGATLDPDGPLVVHTPEGAMIRPFARGGAEREALRAPNIVAIVALAPAGGGVFAAWGSNGLADIHAPLLLIAGDHDMTVDYATNARAFLEAARGTERYLLTYHFGGHAIGLSPSPASMRDNLWDLDWFEDPVWRKDRIVAINLHFITAFLDRYVRKDASRAPYLDVLVEESSAGVWPAAAQGGWADYSPQANGVTIWKGFQRRQATGLELLHRLADGAAR